MNDDTADTRQRQERLQEILLSYVEAAQMGQAPDRREFLAAHPDFADDIAEFLAGYRQLNRLVSPLRVNEPALALRSTEAPGTPADNEPVAELGQLGDYRLLREIGRGGMGVVYEAEQISLRRRVALKILPFAGGVDSRQLQRFRNEAEAAAHLHHSHIVPVFAVGSERGVHFYAMQHIEGQSLATLIAEVQEARGEGRGNHKNTPEPVPVSSKDTSIRDNTVARSSLASRLSPLAPRKVATLGQHTAEALEYAHQMGVVHRDIKPANLLLDARGHVWITDFGLAQFQSQAGLTISGEVLGTLRYVSPEQAMAKRGLVDHRTDIYSLGATLYELLTLHPVFDGKDRHALLQQIGFAEPIPPRTIDPSIPVELETIVLKALAKNPAERYASAQEFADDLQRFLDDQPILAKRPGLIDRTRKWGRRHPSFVVAAVLLLAFGLVGFAVSTFVIAREQARTQSAYDKLDTAYANLEREEKQTKEAYAKLAIEEARTKAAYELAEWDFGQAQRAIELVVQFSEGELAHHPGQQDVRRRLLLTVLDYYEDFLIEHEGDPKLAEGRQRVASILTELAGLRGPALLAIIQDAAVQKDLALLSDQKAKVAQFVGNQAKQMKEFSAKANPKGKVLKAFLSAAAVEKSLGEILDATQKQRFQRIVLQVQQQGRYGFSDPKLVEALDLTSQQREKIRGIQNETHTAWADHLFTDKKIKKPAEFWASVQDRILSVFDPAQREKWQQITGEPITVDLREGYPWDGRNVNVPKPGPVFGFGEKPKGVIAVMQAQHQEYAGSGFGHKIFFDNNQYYSWRGKEIPRTAFEIAVTTQALTDEERVHLLGNDEPAPPTKTKGAPNAWTVLFRADDPAIWNTESPNQTRFAIPVSRAQREIRYLRLKRMDSGEMMIIPISYDQLAQAPKSMGEQNFVWNGTAKDAYGGRHLGIAENRPLHSPKGSPRRDRLRKDQPRPFPE